MSTLVAITTSLFSSQATLRLATLVFAGARDGFVNHVAQVVGGDAGKGLTHLAHGLIEIKSGHCGRCGKQQTFRRENTHYTWVAQLWSIGDVVDVPRKARRNWRTRTAQIAWVVVLSDVRLAAHEIWEQACSADPCAPGGDEPAAELVEYTVAQVSRYLDRIGGPCSRGSTAFCCWRSAARFGPSR